MIFFRTIIFVLFFSIFQISLFGNNLSLSSSVHLVDQDTLNNTTYIKFNLSWDNSWRTSTAPYNYDAVWVFAKFRIKDSTNWNPMTFSPLSTDHYIRNNNSVIPEYKVGLTNGVGKGVFIQRAADGAGSVNWDGVKLKWLYGDDMVLDDDSVEVKVFAIEMVYIPQESFYVGDGTTWQVSGQFSDAADSTMPFQITSENQLTLGGTDTGNLASNDTTGQSIFTHDDFYNNQTQLLPAAYPKGYSSFYAMKYEITQGQYVDFLNTLTRTQQDARTATDLSSTSTTNTFVMSNTDTIKSRNSIKVDANFNAPPDQLTFFNDYNDDGINGDGEHIACNFIHPYDGFAYADWAGLRPVTELEYEKLCRGNLVPVSSEYAWGDSVINLSPYTLIDSAQYNESILNPNMTIGNSINPNTSTSINGPVRSGIFSTNSTSRIQSGAGYYGVMDLTGNLWEQYVDVGNAKARIFTGSPGDGKLTTEGEASNTDWPGYNTSSTDFVKICTRGGGWGGPYLAPEGRVSYRAYANAIAGSWNGSGFDVFRSEFDGFRLGRSN